MTSPLDPRADYPPTLTLNRIKAGIAEPMPYPAGNLTIEQYRDHLADRLIYRLTTYLLAETLPPQQLVVHGTRPRWATWHDHLKATYRRRWWMRWVVRRWPVRYLDEPVQASFTVRADWTYPHAPVSAGMGNPVLKVSTDSQWGYPQ